MSIKLPTRLLAALGAVALLAGCGVKGPPELVSDQPDRYPRVYPQGAVPPEAAPRSIYTERYPPYPH